MSSITKQEIEGLECPTKKNQLARMQKRFFHSLTEQSSPVRNPFI